MVRSAEVNLRQRMFVAQVLSVALVVILSCTFVVTQAERAVGQASVSFSASTLQGAVLNNPTSLDFGPDGRLYVSQQNGVIKAFTIVRGAANAYTVSSVEEITLINTTTPNHDDDGSQNPTLTRQVTGVLLAGTSTNPALYVSSSDWRIAVGEDLGLDTNSGVISRLTCVGGVANGLCQSWEKVDIVRGLPRSEENHSTNGMAIDPQSNVMYVTSGGHSNKGAPSNNLGGLAEYYLSGAILTVDLTTIAAMPVYTDMRNGTKFVYDLPTLDDPTRDNIDNTSPSFPYPQGHPRHNQTIDPGDPFGGNNGLNQAVVEPGGPVQIYSPGYRNPYDVVFTAARRLYTVDNGPNGGWGGLPKLYSTSGGYKGHEAQPGVTFDAAAGDFCTNELNEDGSSGLGDGLHYVSGPGYYGGHPAPIRAFPDRAGLHRYVKQANGTWALDGPPVFLLTELLPPGLTPSDFPRDPRQCTYQALSPSKVLAALDASTNGLTEYTASNLNNALKANLLAAAFDGNIYRFVLDTNGSQVIGVQPVFSGFGNIPLDVTAQGDADVFGGTIWVASYGSGTITVFEPADYEGAPIPVCTGAYDNNLDEDGDLYTNADEIDNNTDPCSAASKPSDNDGTLINGWLVSDLNDPDDDDDGILDVDDPFAIDASNGLSRTLPVNFPFWNNDPGVGMFGLGFTGLMVNGATDYLEMYDSTAIAAGGAMGLMTIEAATGGDALGNANTQENAFQFGVNVSTQTPPFIIHSRLQAPFFEVNGFSTAPVDGQSFGIFLGTGDQDNYVKIVVSANGGAGGISVVREVNGNSNATVFGSTVVGDLLGSGAIDIFAEVSPGNLTVQPKISTDGGVTRITVGQPVDLPADWLDPDDEQGLAVGIIATSSGPGPEFGSTWDFINIDYLPSPASSIITIDTGPSIDGSTFGGGLGIGNTSSNGVTIVGITYDLSTAMLPEVVFDPNGGAGDAVALGFTPLLNSSLAISHTFAAPHEGGYYELSVGFAGFAPGQTFGFGVDIDPISIKGGSAPGPNEAGSVSGLELAGTTVTVRFSNGDAHTVQLYQSQQNSVGASTNIARNLLPGAPSITMLGVNNQSTVTNASQTVRVFGPEGSTVRLLHLEAGLFVQALDGPYAGIGYQIDPWETNSVIAVSQYSGVVENNGYIDFAVQLSNGGPEAGYNLFAAVSAAGDGATSNLSNRLLVRYDSSATPNQPPIVVNPIPDQSVIEGSSPATISLLNVFLDPDSSAPLLYSVTQNTNPALVATSITNGNLLLTYSASGTGTAMITVQAQDASGGTATDQFVVNIISGSGEPSSVLYRVNVGGGELAAADGSLPVWSADTVQTPSVYRSGLGGADIFEIGGAINMTHPSLAGIPAVPTQLFTTERYDPLSPPNMKWGFPVSPGAAVEVRLYFAEIFGGITGAGQRVFDVAVEGVVPAAFDNIDQFQIAGLNAAFVLSTTLVVQDGSLDIDFIHFIENPTLKGIEIVAVRVNQPPVANAGPDVTVVDTDGDGSEAVTLSGAGSTDPDGTIVSYEWRLSGGVIGTGVSVTVNLPVGTHEVTLAVTDNEGATATDTVVVVVRPAEQVNQPPVANAGPDVTVVDTDGDGSEAVTLSGAGSTDPDGTIVSYEWRLSGGVIGTGVSVTVNLPVGTHEVTLAVTDNEDATATDTVVVVVKESDEPGGVSDRKWIYLPVVVR